MREAVLRLDPFRLRRWILTNEWWDDDDNARVEVLAEGTDPRPVSIEMTAMLWMYPAFTKAN